MRLAPILAVHFCGTLGYSIALPFLVFLVTDLGGAPWIYGLVGASYSAAQLVGAPLLGRLSDRTGRRPVLLVSQAGTCVAWLLFLLALQLPKTPLGELAGTTFTVPLVVVFLARMLDGLTGGNVSVANAYVADLTREDKGRRQVAFGRMGMATSLGFTVGPALAGLLGAAGGYTGPVLAAVAISGVGTLLCLTLKEPGGRCPEGPPEQATVGRLLGQQQRRCDRSPASGDRAVLLRAPISWLLVATFVLFLAFNLFYATFPLHASGTMGWDARALGLFYAFLSAAMFVMQGPVLQAVSKRVAPRVVFAAGVGGLALAFGLFPGTTTAVAFGGALLFAFGNGLAWPTFQARTADAAPDDDQGVVQGAASSAGALASIVGLTLGGLGFGSLGAGVFLIGALLFVLVLAATPWLLPAARRAA